jgi:hypothetical protein
VQKLGLSAKQKFEYWRSRSGKEYLKVRRRGSRKQRKCLMNRIVVSAFHGLFLRNQTQKN